MYRHILVPTDGSELAERAVAHGSSLAKCVGAKVTLLIVEEVFNYTPLEGAGAPAHLSLYAEEIKKFATTALDRAAVAAKKAGISFDTLQLRDAPPHQAILAVASERACDLIVMASHGRSGLSAILLGSVTNKVLTHAKTPVLVCH